VVFVRFLARFVTLPIVRPQAQAVDGPRYRACVRTLVWRHNRCAAGPRKRLILVLPARYRRVRRRLASWITLRKGAGMGTVRRYSMLIDEIFGPVLAGRLDRRAYALLLSTPPD
jgi:hypothetical protein